MSQDFSPGAASASGPLFDVLQNVTPQYVENLPVKNNELDALAGQDCLSEADQLQQIQELKTQNANFQEALLHSFTYIATIRDRIGAIVTQDRALESLYTAWCIAFQRCDVPFQPCTTPSISPMPPPIPVTAEGVTEKPLDDQIVGSPSALNANESVQGYGRTVDHPESGVSIRPKVLRDCLVIQTDGISEALQDEAVHMYTAEVRLLKEKIIILQEEFAQERSLRLSSEKLVACLQSEFRVQEESLKECSNEKEMLHEQIRLLKESIYTLETSVEKSSDENISLNGKIRQLKCYLSEIKVQIDLLLEAFGKRPAIRKPSRPASAAVNRRVGTMYDADLSSMVEEIKQVYTFVITSLNNSSGQRAIKVDTPSDYHPLSQECATICKEIQTDSLTEVPINIPSPSLMAQSVIQQIYETQDLPTSVVEVESKEELASVQAILKNNSDSMDPPYPTLESVMQHLQYYTTIQKRLSVALAEAESARILMQNAMKDQQSIQDNASKYQSRFTRVEAELNRTTYVLHSLMELIINFDASSEQPILDTAACVDCPKTKEALAYNMISNTSSAYVNSMLIMVKGLQERIKSLELEGEKLRASNLMLLKREAYNINTTRQMEKQIHRLTEENFLLTGENTLLLSGQSPTNPAAGSFDFSNEIRSLREQLADTSLKLAQLRNEYNKLASSHKSVKIELNEERGRRTRAEDRYSIMKDELQEVTEDRRSRSTSHMGSRRSSISGHSSTSAVKEDPFGVQDTTHNLKRTIAAVRLKNLNLAGQVEALLYNEQKTKQYITQLLLENQTLLTEGVYKDSLIHSLQSEAQRHLQTLTRICVIVPPKKSSIAPRGTTIELEKQLSTRDSDLVVCYEERIQLETQKASLCADINRITMENLRLSTENDRLVNELKTLRNIPRNQSGKLKGDVVIHETVISAIDGFTETTPCQRSNASNNRLQSTFAKAEEVLNQKRSFSEFSVENEHIRPCFKSHEHQYFAPHDTLLRMAKYLNEKEEELFNTIEITREHNAKLELLRRYANQLQSDNLNLSDTPEEDLEAKFDGTPNSKVRQALHKLVTGIISLELIECKTTSFHVSTASELLQKFTSPC